MSCFDLYFNIVLSRDGMRIILVIFLFFNKFISWGILFFMLFLMIISGIFLSRGENIFVI